MITDSDAVFLSIESDEVETGNAIPLSDIDRDTALKYNSDTDVPDLSIRR